MLKITRACDPITVSRVTVTIYAQPGLGRTSTAFTSGALLLDFDHGAYRSAFRRDAVLIDSWDDVRNITAEDMAPYPAIAVDTAGRALDFMAQDIIRENPKLGRGSDLTLQGYGVLKGRFASWLKHLHGLGKDVVLLAHMDEQRKGDDVIERLDITGSSRQEIYKISDAMARLYFENGKRRLNFNPGDAAFGKNPAMLPVFDVPDFNKDPHFLASVLATIKAKLNEGTAAMIAERKKLEQLQADFAGLEGVDEFNLQIEHLAGAEPKIKALLVAAATANGLVLDKATKKFTTNGVGIPQPAGAKAMEAGTHAENGERGVSDELNRTHGASDSLSVGSRPASAASAPQRGTNNRLGDGSASSEPMDPRAPSNSVAVEATKGTGAFPAEAATDSLELRHAARKKFFWWIEQFVKAKIQGYAELKPADASQQRHEFIAKLIGELVEKPTAEQYEKACIRLSEIYGTHLTEAAR